MNILKSAENDTLLVQKVKDRTDNNDPAFEQLYKKYNPFLYKMVYSVVKNHHDTLDILQEIWSNFLAHVERSNIENYFKLWLLRVARNLSINYLRKSNQRSIEINFNLPGDKEISSQLDLNDPEDIDVPDELKTSLSPSDFAHWSGELKRINGIIHKCLKRKNAQVMVLTGMGHSMEEIGNRLKLKVGYIGFIQHKARKRLTHIFGTKYFTQENTRKTYLRKIEQVN